METKKEDYPLAQKYIKNSEIEIPEQELLI